MATWAASGSEDSRPSANSANALATRSGGTTLGYLRKPTRMPSARSSIRAPGIAPSDAEGNGLIMAGTSSRFGIFRGAMQLKRKVWARPVRNRCHQGFRAEMGPASSSACFWVCRQMGLPARVYRMLDPGGCSSEVQALLTFRGFLAQWLGSLLRRPQETCRSGQDLDALSRFRWQLRPNNTLAQYLSQHTALLAWTHSSVFRPRPGLSPSHASGPPGSAHDVWGMGVVEVVTVIHAPDNASRFRRRAFNRNSES